MWWIVSNIHEVLIDFRKVMVFQKQPPEVLCKKRFIEISQNSPENTRARVSFLIKLQGWGCEFCEISKNTPLQNTSGGCFWSLSNLKIFKTNVFRFGEDHDLAKKIKTSCIIDSLNEKENVFKKLKRPKTKFTLLHFPSDEKGLRNLSKYPDNFFLSWCCMQKTRTFAAVASSSKPLSTGKIAVQSQ